MNCRRRLLVAAAALIGLPLATALVVLVAAAVFGVTFDASPWRDAIARRASVALERPVILEGAFELTLGREVALRIGGARVLNASGFTGREFLLLGEARARFNLLDALRGRLRIGTLEASDVRLSLERAADGRTNWALAPREGLAPPEGAINIGQITLRRIAIDFNDAGAKARHVFALEELSASARSGEPTRMAVRGRANKDLAYAVTLEGGPLGLIREASASWPFSLDFESSGTRLQARGGFDAGRGEARFEFNGSARDITQFGRLLDISLPRAGAFALHGTGRATADLVELADLQGALGSSGVSGHLALALDADRPCLSGSLRVDSIDLREFVASDPAPDDRRAGDDALVRQSLHLRDLMPVDLDIGLNVGRWLGTPLDIRDARFALRADARGVQVPVTAMMGRAPVSGQLKLDTVAPTPTLAVRLDAVGIAPGDLAQLLTGANHAPLVGRLSRMGLQLDGRGETLGALVDDIELRLNLADARLSYSNFASDRPITLTLDALQLDVRRGERLRATGRGTLQGETAKLALRGGTLPDMLGALATPVELDLATPHARLRIEGMLAPRGAPGEADLRFEFQAPRSGDLARWLSVAPESSLPLDLRGRARLAGDAWSLHETTLRIGRSALTLDMRRSRSGARPVTVAAVSSPMIDLPELATLRAHTAAGGTPGSRLDRPILASALDLADADVGLALAQVAFGNIDAMAVGFTARVRDGRLLPSAVTGKVAGAPFKGLVALDPRGQGVDVSLDLFAREIDVGALLRELGVAQDIDGVADALHFTLLGRGNTLRELAGHSEFGVRLSGGGITLRGAAERPLASIRVSEATIGAAAGAPVRARLDGTLDQTPVAIEVTGGTLTQVALDPARLPLTLAATAAGARLTLEGEVALPLGRAGNLMFEMGGERLDTLSGLLRVELPPWGPWSFRGPIKMTSNGYQMPEMQVRVGESRLQGSGRLDVTGPRPRLEVKAGAPRIWLDDFPMPERLTDSPSGAAGSMGLRAAGRNLAGQTERLLSAGVLRRLDAVLDVEVQQVLSGTDRLADGAMHLAVIDGRLDFGPAHVNTPGGAMRLSGRYDPTGEGVALIARANLERFDYSVIARRLGRANDLLGLVSLDLELSGRAPSMEGIMDHASGKIAYSVWPSELRGGLVRLWASNVILVLLPAIDPGGQAQVNCVVGRFELREGKLTDDRIMIDTTRVRVRGAGTANLATEELAFVFHPRAKGVSLFRLKPPLHVTGSFSDFQIGVDRRDLPEAILRMILSPVLLPIQRLTLGPLPRDGADVCAYPQGGNASPH
jgi:uncharacterized protein involved in outer membrane biogenesis